MSLDKLVQLRWPRHRIKPAAQTRRLQNFRIVRNNDMAEEGRGQDGTAWAAAQARITSKVLVPTVPTHPHLVIDARHAASYSGPNPKLRQAHSVHTPSQRGNQLRCCALAGGRASRRSATMPCAAAEVPYQPSPETQLGRKRYLLAHRGK